jgi:hypothetical protein
MSRKDKPRDQMLGHADEADGIEEYDNPLPDWWLGLFWFTIIWAVAYTLHYHVIADRSQEKALAAEIAAAEARWPAGGAAAEFVVTPELADGGARVYQTNCGGVSRRMRWRAASAAPERRRVAARRFAAGSAAHGERGRAGEGHAGVGPDPGTGERVRQVTAYILSQQSE